MASERVSPVTLGETWHSTLLHEIRRFDRLPPCQNCSSAGEPQNGQVRASVQICAGRFSVQRIPWSLLLFDNVMITVLIRLRSRSGR
jgi:hypothetical protein